MKRLYIFLALFLIIGGVISANAQDLIVLKDGNMIEAKVVEISPTEIKYKLFDHLDGPTIIIPIANVLSIRYENGRIQRFGEAISSTRQESVESQTAAPNIYAMDPNKLNFGLSINAAGFIPNAGGGPSITFDFNKRKFNAIIEIRSGLGFIPSFYGYELFGISSVFNYFAASRIGGFYIGGMVKYSVGENLSDEVIHRFGLAGNIGYKFVTRSGMYFRTGFKGGYSFGEGNGLIVRPDLSFGYNFQGGKNSSTTESESNSVQTPKNNSDIISPPILNQNIIDTSNAPASIETVIPDRENIIIEGGNYTVESISGRVQFQRNFEDAWEYVKVGDVFSESIRIRIALNSTLVLNDGRRAIEFFGGKEGRIDSLLSMPIR